MMKRMLIAAATMIASAITPAAFAAGPPPVPYGDIAVSATALDYWLMDLGATKTLELTVGNAGTADLNISTVSVGAESDYTIASDTCSAQAVMPDATCAVSVTYSPSLAGEAANQVTILSDDADTPELSVSLRGYGLSSTGNNPPTAPVLRSPASGAVLNAPDAALSWYESTDPDGDLIEYAVHVCTDPTFASCTPDVVVSKPTGMRFAGAGMALSLFGFAMAFGARGRGRLLAVALAVIVAGGALASCSGIDNIEPGSTNVGMSIGRTSSSTPAVPTGVHSLYITISGEGMESISQTVAISKANSGGVAQEFQVTNGPARKFMVEAKNMRGSLLFSGERVVDLAGVPVTVDVTLSRDMSPATTAVDVPYATLEPGIYYWKVGASDDGGLTSAESAIGTFTIR